MSTDHQHAGFEIPTDYTDPAGRTINHDLLGQFIGAAYDRCTSCQDAHLTLMVEDAATTARLVELACVATASAFGGLPASMTDDAAPGPSSPEFRRLARAGLDGNNDTMFAECAAMTITQRRAAANTAAGTLVGHLSLGG